MTDDPRLVARDRLVAGAGFDPSTIRPLAADASFRSYHRTTDTDGHRHAVLMDAPPGREDIRPFVRIARLLQDWQLSAPQILAEDPIAGYLLLEDLGDGLFSRLNTTPERTAMLYAAAVEVLAQIGRHPVPDDLPRHDLTCLLDEVALFLDWRWPEIVGRPATDAERQGFRQAWEAVLTPVASRLDTLVHRDFFLDNLIWLPDRQGVQRVGLLDFQDAVAGHPAYDLVSLLADARRDVDPGLARAMLHRYLDLTGHAAEPFRVACAALGAQRNTRILGVFTRLWRRDGKPGYCRWLARCWRLVQRDLAQPGMEPVAAWFAAHVPVDTAALEMEERT